MPKQKSHRGAAKRFSFTKTKRTRHLRADGIVDNAAEAKTIHKLLPYK